MSGLFVPGDFTSHSGLALRWKIEGDALSPAEWAVIAGDVAHMLAPAGGFHDVVGVPRGGVPFEEALRPHALSNGRFYLIVDDVLTTGASMHEWRDTMTQAIGAMEWLGVVAFSRVGLSPRCWIKPWMTKTEWKL